MTENYGAGFFGGRVIKSSSGSIGGTRHVFVGLKDNKHQLVFPTIGMKVLNVPNGSFKMFEGDLVEFKTNGEGYILRTFKVAAATTAAGSEIKVLRSGFLHKPIVGDVLMVAGAAFSTTGTGVTVTKVVSGTEGSADVYTLTLSAEIAAVAKGAILVEADKVGTGAKMLVQNPNMQLPWDMDFMYDNSAVEDVNEKAKYYLTPAFSAFCWTDKMSPMPPAVVALNQSTITGWFKLKN